MKQIESLGTDYNLIDEYGSLLKSIKLVSHEDLLSATLGEYSDDYYTDYRDYIKGCKEKLAGFAPDMNKVLWYAYTAGDYDFNELIQYCVEQDYDYVITEVKQQESLELRVV